MTFSLIDVEASLEGCSADVKQWAGHTYAVLECECPRAMRGESVPKNYLSTRARAVYKNARRSESLIALQKALWALYLNATKASPELVPPFLFLPLDDIETAVTEKSPCFALQEALNAALEQALQSRNGQEATFAHALALAKRLKITASEKLLSVLNHRNNALVIINELKTGVMTIATDHYYLDSVSIIHLRRAREGTYTSMSLKKSFSAFLSGATPSTHVENCSLNDALEALSFDERSMTRNNLLDASEHLSPKSLIKALSGHTAELGTTSGSPVQTRQKRALPIQEQNVSEKEFFTTFERLAFNSTPSSSDEYLLKRFSLILDELKSQNPDEKRNTSAFTAAQNRLTRLLREAQSDTGNISLIAYLLLYYLTDIFLFGSKFGNKLAIGSVQTYRSTLLTYLKDVWASDDELRLAQNSDDGLLELSELAANALGDKLGRDQQNTILHFLSFVNEVSPYRLFDVDEMEYLGAPVSKRRAHYITQSDFEAACARFINESNAIERQRCVLKMKLCYYGGLRSSEADNLLVRDINVDTDVIYVTRLIKRKSQRAVRRVPLCFFPAETLNELTLLIEEQKQAEHVLLQPRAKYYLESRFIDILREQCGENSLVIHSLRHSAANNMLFMLSMASFHQVYTARPHVFFLSQALFNDEQLHRVKLAFKAQQRDLTPWFPLLDSIATYLGHVCAAVTANNYLHLLDFLLFIVERPVNARLPSSYLKSLLAKNNHLFEQLKRYDNAAKSSEDTLFKIAIHGLEDKKCYDKLTRDLPETTPAKFSFRLYLSAIEDYQTKSRSLLLTDKLKEHLNDTGAALAEISFIESLSSREFPAFLRFCERITRMEWQPININALRSFLSALESNKITRERELLKYLRALNIIGLKNQHIQLYNAQNAHSEIWSSHIVKFGHKIMTTHNQATAQNMVIAKPAFCRYSLWPHLKTLVSLVLSYADLKET